MAGIVRARLQHNRTRLATAARLHTPADECLLRAAGPRSPNACPRALATPMKLIQNAGLERVIDLIGPHLQAGHQLGCVTPTFSLFAFAAVRQALGALGRAQWVVPPDAAALQLLGGPADRAARNQLQARWLAGQCAAWLQRQAELRYAHGPVPQGALVLCQPDGTATQGVLGSLAFSTDGLGLVPGNPLSLIQACETPAEAAQLARWFDQQWAGLPASPPHPPHPPHPPPQRQTHPP